MDTKIEDYDYDLPERFIAQVPVSPRDACKMLVYNKMTNCCEIKHFYNIIDYLHAGDVVIINETRVIPSRLFGVKESGARVEILLLQKQTLDTYTALVRPMKRLHVGETLNAADRLTVEMLSKDEAGGTAVVKLSHQVVPVPDISFENLLDEIGEMPLPPYIHSGARRWSKGMSNSPFMNPLPGVPCKLHEQAAAWSKPSIAVALPPAPPGLAFPRPLPAPAAGAPRPFNTEYNTVYAKINGSAAAPTAGLHWTDELIKRVKEKGVIFAPIVLNVGLGTFRPVKTADIRDHNMHGESYSIPESTAKIINAALKDGRRIICTGTTSLRALEGCFAAYGAIKAVNNADTNIFIYPPYKFHAANGLITNFHLPKSTLIMLVSAFIGREKTLELYKTARDSDFRFFSFGDCMFLIS